MFRPVSRVLEKKELWVSSGESSLDRLLGVLLEFWGYHIVENPEEASLLLVERNLEYPAAKPGIFLGEAPCPFPLSLENLWCELESRFNRKPRSHIRITSQLKARISVRDQIFRGGTVNITDMGARVSCSMELEKGETLLVYLTLGAEVLRLSGRVIYVLGREEVRGWPSYDIGILFEGTSDEQRQTLRNAIIETYLSWALEAPGGGALQSALTFMDIPPTVLERLKRVRPIK